MFNFELSTSFNYIFLTQGLYFKIVNCNHNKMLYLIQIQNKNLRFLYNFQN